MTNYRTRGERIPAAAVLPYVQEWIEAWYGIEPGGEITAVEHPYITPDDVIRDHPEWGITLGKASESVAVLVLASRSGVNPSALGMWMRRWRRGVPQGLGYFDVDMLFVAMGRVGLWFQDPVISAFREECIASMSDTAATVQDIIESNERTQ